MTDGDDNATKKLIRDTATRLFREKSFEDVTLSEICKASGINKHTFYYYYKSKDELLKHYYHFPWRLTAAEAADILTSENYMDQIWLIVQKYIDFVNTAGVQIVRQILIKNLTKDVGTFRVGDERKDMLRLEISIIKKGQQCGQFGNRTNPVVLAILMQQILYSNGLLWAIFQGDFDVEKCLRFFLENLLDVEESCRKTSEKDLQSFTSLFPEIPKENRS